MGLDMYLTARLYVSKHFNEECFNQVNAIEFPGKGDMSIREVEAEAIYWRKANQIHGWFVRHVQDGKDDCEHYYVTREQLQELLDTCREVFEKKDSSLLAPQSGFFFGSTEIDEWYWEDITRTIKALEELLNRPDLEQWDFYYHSSW